MSGVLRRSGAGVMKLTQLKEKLAASGMAWTEDFSPGAVKAIGSLEVLAAIGLILLMTGAAITHARRREPQGIVVNLVLLALAAVVLWGRFGPASFTV